MNIKKLHTSWWVCCEILLYQQVSYLSVAIQQGNKSHTNSEYLGIGTHYVQDLIKGRNIHEWKCEKNDKYWYLGICDHHIHQGHFGWNMFTSDPSLKWNKLTNLKFVAFYAEEMIKYIDTHTDKNRICKTVVVMNHLKHHHLEIWFSGFPSYRKVGGKGSSMYQRNM